MPSKWLHLENLRLIYERAVESVQPRHLFQCHSANGLTRKEYYDGRVIFGCQGQRFDLTNKCCHVVGFGKGVLAMAVQMYRILGPSLKHGILSLPKGTLNQFPNERDFLLNSDPKIRFYEGAENNQPDDVALAAAKDIKGFAETMTPKDILFVLITGGGSALLPLPRSPLKLHQKRNLLRDLSNKGATIEELNIVRIALSDIKGGRLALAASKAHAIITLIISDIIGDPIDLIASGPTVPPKEHSLKAQEILDLYGMKLTSHYSDNVLDLLLKTEEYPDYKNNYVFLVGSNRIALETALTEASIRGYLPFILTAGLGGFVEDVEEIYCDLVKNINSLKSGSIRADQFKENVQSLVDRDSKRTEELVKLVMESISSGKPLLLISGGEPTVKVIGTGLGGRNQELALRMSIRCHTDPEFGQKVFFLSAGTDGIDGPTPAAGAIGSSMVIEEFLASNAQNGTPYTYLKNNDSYHFYETMSRYHIISGHTGTNVMDIHLLLICP